VRIKRRSTEGAGPDGARSELRRVVHLLVEFSRGRRYVLALGMLVAEAITAVFQPYPIAYLVDFLKGDRGPLKIALPWLSSARSETIAALIIMVIVLTIVNSLADSMAEIYLARAGRVLGYNVRRALHSRLQRLSLAFHDQRRAGDMVTRLTSDVTALEDFIVQSVSDLAGSVLLLLGTLAFLFYKSWEIAVVALLIVPVLALISNYFSRRIKTASRQQRAREGELASAAQEMLTSIRVVQAYGRSEYEEQRFADPSRKSMEAALEAATLQAKFSWVVAVLEAVTISTVVWIGVWLTDRGAITVGTVVLFVILIQNMFKPTRKIIREWSLIGKVYASAERIAEILEREPTVRDAPDAVPAPPFAGRLVFDHVSFAYRPDATDTAELEGGGRRVALRDMSFFVEPGRVLALVGRSGAGKSTIAQLVPRLYDPDDGAVLVDGVDIRRFTIESLRSQISVVLQDTVLFSGTVAFNIAYGREHTTREEIVEAAIKANADQFIRELPEGYDTMLGERAANLSGGQRQRIAIARAFIRRTPILILDEPTTGLDATASELVLRGLETLIREQTTIIISHNLNLIRAADTIVVVNEGRIAQVGTHRRLLKKGGQYADFYAKQHPSVKAARSPGRSTQGGDKSRLARERIALPP
jgi:ABC-type multidrug transport system fused ATPase/permease subunit